MKFVKTAIAASILGLTTSAHADVITINVSDNGGFAEFHFSGSDTVTSSGSNYNGFWMNDLFELGAYNNTPNYTGKHSITSGSADFIINGTSYAIQDIWVNSNYDHELGIRSHTNPSNVTTGDSIGLSGSFVTDLNFSTFNEGSYAFSHVGPYDTSQYTLSEGVVFNVGNVVSAVPEPSTYAMMMGGLGLVGLMAARRKKQA